MPTQSYNSPAHWSGGTVVRWRPLKYEWLRKRKTTASQLAKNWKINDREFTVGCQEHLAVLCAARLASFVGGEAVVGGSSLGPVEEER